MYRNLKSFINMLYYEIKIYMREPSAVTTAFMMPLFFLLVNMEGIMPIRDPRIDDIIPSIIVLVMVSNALYSLPVSIATYRTTKYFKRLKGTSASPLLSVLAIGISNFIIILLGILSLIIVSIYFYDAEFKGEIFTFSIGFVLTVLSIMSIGFFIASICHTVREAQSLGEIMMLIMMFFSDLLVSTDLQPDWVGDYIAPLLTPSYGVKLIRGLWEGDSIYEFYGEISIMVGFLIILTFVSTWLFKLE